MFFLSQNITDYNINVFLYVELLIKPAAKTFQTITVYFLQWNIVLENYLLLTKCCTYFAFDIL